MMIEQAAKMLTGPGLRMRPIRPLEGMNAAMRRPRMYVMTAIKTIWMPSACGLNVLIVVIILTSRQNTRSTMMRNSPSKARHTESKKPHPKCPRILRRVVFQVKYLGDKISGVLQSVAARLFFALAFRGGR
jgi:hypothetical protein